MTKDQAAYRIAQQTINLHKYSRNRQYYSRPVSGQVFILLVLAGIFLLAPLSQIIDPQASADAAYYHIMATQLHEGNGFVEPFVWNHLKKDQQLNKPTDYWLPLGIVIYYLFRFVSGAANEIWINILIWSWLSAMVFCEVKKNIGSPVFSITTFLMFVFHGLNLFDLFTTDNNAFLAVIGFFFIEGLCSDTVRVKSTACAAGFYCLLRIEGAVFALSGGIASYLRLRSTKYLLFYLAIAAIIVLPWALRNYQVHGTFWPSNSSSLYLSSYGDFFNDKPVLKNSVLEFDAETAKEGFAAAFISLLILPSNFILLPFFIAGMLVLRRTGGATAGFMLLVILMCSFIFPLQAKHGTAQHISAFFYPHFFILTGTGLYKIVNKFGISRKVALSIALALVLYNMLASFGSVFQMKAVYDSFNQPYKKLFSQIKPHESEVIISPSPILVYLLTRCAGVYAGNLTNSTPFQMAEKYNASLVLTDARKLHKNNLVPENWYLLENYGVLKLYTNKLTGKNSETEIFLRRTP